MESSISGVLLSFLMFFVLLVKYWFISVPVVVVLIVWYVKTKNNILKKALRVVLALVAISLLIGLILFVFGR